jgi:hypothetical protein
MLVLIYRQLSTTEIEYPMTNVKMIMVIRHPDFRVKHCAYGHSTATLLNPRGITTVSRKYSLTVPRHTTVVVAVPSIIHYPAKYKIKIYYLT